MINDKNCGKINSYKLNKDTTYEIIFDFKNKLDSLDGFFEGNINLIYADLSKLQIDNIESMVNLFKNCINLKEVFIDNKTPNLKNLSNMFHNCTSHDILHLNIDTSNVSKMDFMFSDCSKLTKLDISNYSLEKVTDTSSMFQGCTDLKEIKFKENTLTRNLEDMNSMFNGCYSLEYINTKIFHVNKVTNLSYTFAQCYNIEKLDLTNFKAESIMELSGTFFDCYSLKKLNLSKFDTSKVTKMDFMFMNAIL